jgi:hypothetical protein
METSENSPFRMWTVYDRPTDYPTGFIARLFLIYSTAVVATDQTVSSPDVAVIRQLLANQGLFCMPRDESDDPKIVESWF